MRCHSRFAASSDRSDAACTKYTIRFCGFVLAGAGAGLRGGVGFGVARSLEAGAAAGAETCGTCFSAAADLVGGGSTFGASGAVCVAIVAAATVGFSAGVGAVGAEDAAGGVTVGTVVAGACAVGAGAAGTGAVADVVAVGVVSVGVAFGDAVSGSAGLAADSCANAARMFAASCSLFCDPGVIP